MSYMSYTSSKPEAGIALLLNTFLGVFGADKFYVGRYDLGILQIILTITVFGLFINIPWVALCSISLFIAIFLGGVPFMYPGIQWADISNRDKIIAVVLLVLMIIGSFTRSRTQTIQNYEDTTSNSTKLKKCEGYGGSCNIKENYGSCSSCSKRMLPPY